jgi:CRISPR-associated protein Cas1
MSNEWLPVLKPIPLRDRLSILFIEKGRLDVLDGAFVVVDKTGVRTHIPVGGVACLMLEIGTRVSHAAVALAARAGTLLVWVGEAGVRLYSAGQPGGARADKLLHQAKLALDPERALLRCRRLCRWFRWPCGRVPRVRGDEPICTVVIFWPTMCSPRAPQTERVTPAPPTR